MYSLMWSRAFILAIVFMLAVPAISMGIQTDPEAMEQPILETGALVGRIICVDPGHGGTDTGTTGLDGPGYPDEKAREDGRQSLLRVPV